MTWDVTSTAAPVSPAKTGDARGAITIRLSAGKAEWDSLIASCPDPHLPQGFAYGEGKAAKGWTAKRVVFSRGSTPIAIATILELRRFGFRLGSRVNRGPLLLEANPTEATIVGVYRALRRWRGPLMVAAALPAGADGHRLLRRAGYRRFRPLSWRSGRIDLSGGEDSIWKSFGPGFRNRYRKAEAAGATLRIAADDETFEWMLARHTENMVAKGFTAVDADFLRAMRAASPADMLVFQAIHDGKPVAGMTVARFGTHAEYHVGWFGPDGRKINAGNFLMWSIMREMARRGVTTFDVGGMREGDGYTQFKQTMRPAEYDLAGEWISFF